MHIDASIGIALFPEHARDALGLLQRADVAMYEAKRMRTGHEVYLPSRDRHSRGRGWWASCTGRSRPASCPALPAQGRRADRRRAASRRSCAGSTRSAAARPGHFLPLVEQSGLTRALTSFVIDRALCELAEAALARLDLDVAVNLGPADLLDLELPSEVELSCRCAGARPSTCSSRCPRTS